MSVFDITNSLVYELDTNFRVLTLKGTLPCHVCQAVQACSYIPISHEKAKYWRWFCTQRHSIELLGHHAKQNPTLPIISSIGEDSIFAAQSGHEETSGWMGHDATSIVTPMSSRFFTGYIVVFFVVFVPSTKNLTNSETYCHLPTELTGSENPN